jgi:hypothetical protein
MKNVLLAALFAATAVMPVLAEQVAPAAAEDPLFNEPYVDVDEWRDTPVRHRYVHGGFKGTDMRFSFYMPPKEKFQGRFFQYVTPVPDSENLSQTVQAGDDNIGFAAASGAYFVETNGGGKSATSGPAFQVDPSIGAYRANAAAAQFSRKLAREMYGVDRVYGYIYGGSGGAYRTFGSIENTTVWDGAVPFVAGSPMASPNNFSVRMHAMRVLKDKFPQIVDAMDAGGSGNPYAGLSDEEAAALREATRMGFPVKSWFGHKDMGVHGFTAVYQGMVMADPSYFQDFWTKPGYLGFDKPESFAKARVQITTKVTLALSTDDLIARGLAPKRIAGQPDDDGRGTADLAWKALVDDGSKRTMAFELADAPPEVGFLGGDLFVLSGAAKGKRIALLALNGNVATLGVVDLAVIAQLKPGDEVRVDNSNFLAAQTYHRHQVPDASYKAYDQFRKADGSPIYPQRQMLLGPLFARGAAGTVPSGKFNGKIILVGSMLDREAFVWNTDWYTHRFDEHFSSDAPNKYRVWLTDHAVHGHNEDKGVKTRVIGYLPVLQQALRDVSAWVEKGITPPDSSGYRYDNGQIVLAETAKARKSIQPMVKMDTDRIAAKVGKPIRLTANAEVPPGTGKIVFAAWDFDGSGAFAENAKLPKKPSAKVKFSTTHSFDKPGTYFVTIKVESERDGNLGTPYARIPNIARLRVVVSE